MNFEAKQQQYQKALDLLGVKLKGKNNLYTSHNGHMYSFLGKENILAVRLSEADKKSYNEKHGTEDVIQYGAVMRGYVEVTDKILSDTDELASLIQRGLDYVSTLEPK